MMFVERRPLPADSVALWRARAMRAEDRARQVPEFREVLLRAAEGWRDMAHRLARIRARDAAREGAR